MKIIILCPPQNWLSKDYLPPLGLGYIAASLEAEGHSIKIIDSFAEKLSVKKSVEKVINLKPDALGITCTTHNRFTAIEIIKEIKKIRKDIFIFAGGPHFSPTVIDALNQVPQINAIVKGEGDETIKELIKAYKNSSDFSKIKGIAYCSTAGNIFDNPNRSYIKNLDSIPFPAYHLFSHSKYDASLEGEYKTKSIGVISSRGCPYLCVFCQNSVLKNVALRLRSANNFVDEIELLINKYNYSAFDFWDDTFTVNKKHVYSICQEILRRNLKIKWYARAAIKNIDKELLLVMKKAGCVALGYGIESGSNRILKIIKKNTTVEKIKEVVKMSWELNYFLKLFFIYSHPTETLQDVKKTKNLIKYFKKNYKNNLVIGYGYTIVYPGTEIEDLAKKEGIISDNFSWNVYQEFSKSKFFQGDPTIPFFENKNLKLEEIYFTVHKKTFLSIIKKSFAILKRIKNINDFKTFLNLSINYLKEKL